MIAAQYPNKRIITRALSGSGSGPAPAPGSRSNCSTSFTSALQAIWWNWAECNDAYQIEPPDRTCAQDHFVPPGWIFLAGGGGECTDPQVVVRRYCDVKPGIYKILLPLLNFGCIGSTPSFRANDCAPIDDFLYGSVENKMVEFNGVQTNDKICYFTDTTTVHYLNACVCDEEHCPGIPDVLFTPCLEPPPNVNCTSCKGMDASGNGWFGLWEGVEIKHGDTVTVEQGSRLPLPPPDGPLCFNVRYEIMGDSSLFNSGSSDSSDSCD